MLKKINNNKVLMISHIADIDGAGSIILGEKYYQGKIDYILAENNDLYTIFSNDLRNYDLIYLCDLSLTEEAYNLINNNENIKSKLKYFDHHASKIKINDSLYTNCHTKINNRKTCGTELTFNYLLTLPNNEVINKPFYYELVEAIRENDTWDFQEGNNLPSILSSLHVLTGPIPFINLILNLNDNESVKIPEIYTNLITADQEKMHSYINYANKHLLITTYQDYKIGVTISESYRSQLGDNICSMHPEIAFILIINFSRMSCSLRTVRDDLDLGIICQNFHHNGGGHKKAAGFSIDNESIPKIAKYIDEYVENLKTILP